MDTPHVQLLHLADLALLAPELTLVIAAIVISLIDLALPRRIHRDVMGVLSLLAVVVSLGFVLLKLYQRAKLTAEAAQAVQLLEHSYRIDGFALVVKAVILIGVGFVIMMSLGNLRKEELPYRGEYYYLLLPAAIGGMMMASSGDLLTLYVGLELLSITSYILVAMKKNDSKSTESAFKYTVLGSVASAFILYGMSFLYGISGSTAFNGIAHALADRTAGFESLIYVSFILMIVGFGFKIAAAPFHAWAPDVYQGALTPISAFLGVVSKAATLAVVFRMFYSMYLGLGQDMAIYSDLSTILLSIAALSMIVGTTMALRQANVKRLLALSGIANAGYLLVPVSLNLFGQHLHTSNFAEFMYYLIAYLLMTFGAFAVHMVVERSSGHDHLSGYAGLYYRSPWLAVAMTVIVLSLAGIPITAGFFGKLFIILGAIASHTLWIAIVMMVASVVSFYFYFGFIRQMYMRGDNEEAVRIPWTQGLVIVVCVLAIIGLGAFPNPVIEALSRVFSIGSDLLVR